MPWTFAHPAAVLPLRRFTPGLLSFSTLVVGSLMPDLGYYVGQFELATFATLKGSFLFCVPAGFLVLALLCWLRAPLVFLLPQPHRGALTPLAAPFRLPSFRGGVVALVSLLLGAWTHNAWDSMTHNGAWTVEHFAILESTVFRMGVEKLPLYYFIQQASTVGGTLVVAVAYLRWLSKQRRALNPPDFQPDSLGELKRYLVLFLLALVAFGIAVPIAWSFASGYEGYLVFRSFVYRTAVYGTALYVPLLLVAAMLMRHWHHRTNGIPGSKKYASPQGHH